LREDVELWLQNWFRSRGKTGQSSTGQSSTGQSSARLADTDYFEAGWVTSMEIVEFVMEIEAQFGMQFSDRDLQDPRFVTISGLTGLIVERSTQPSQAG
jgi:acyl carrier protein